MTISGADIIVRTLIEQGCEIVFGYPGGQILNVYDSLYKYQDKIRHVLTAHEQGASHAADGYARATGKVGVVMSTSGPGATNLVTGIATAYLDSIPMVAICGNVPTSQIGTDSFQEIDITGITLPITKHNFFVGTVERLADTIREAFRLALSGRPGPVLVDVPKDVQIATCEYAEQPPVTPDERSAAKDIRIRQAADCINSAEKPYIYFGGGVISAGAQEEMLALAEKIDAPLGCSMMGLSAIPTDYPRLLGMQGMHGHYASSMAMHHADCIVALGVRFNDRATGNRTKFAGKARVVHIDIDGSELFKTVNTVHGLRGDVKKNAARAAAANQGTEKTGMAGTNPSIPRGRGNVSGQQNRLDAPKCDLNAEPIFVGRNTGRDRRRSASDVGGAESVFQKQPPIYFQRRPRHNGLWARRGHRRGAWHRRAQRSDYRRRQLRNVPSRACDRC